MSGLTAWQARAYLELRPPPPRLGWLLILLLMAAVACAMLLLCPFAGAEDAPQTVAAPVSPAVTVALEGWILGQRTWAQGAEPRDLPGSRIQAEVRWQAWRFGIRGDVTGLPGEYVHGKLETVHAAEVHLAVARDMLTIPGKLTVGPAGAIGAGVALDTKDGARISTPKSLTAGLGVRVSWADGWLYAVIGQAQALPGVAVLASWQVKVSDRVANIGTVAVGASGHYVATCGVAVRWR